MPLDRNTGAEQWRAELTGSHFVDVLLDGNQVLAATKGEIFCLHRSTGQILWLNPLGLVTMAIEGGPTQTAVLAEQMRQKAASSAAPASASTVATTLSVT